MSVIWKVLDTQRDADTGMVFNVIVEATASNDVSSVQTGALTVGVEPSSSANYIPYEQLTEDMLLSWVFPHINKTEIERVLLLQLDRKQDKPLNGLPW